MNVTYITCACEQPALVISGPNAGGKTVVLKTVGLCALLVQHGCWVPCEEGTRVDLFGNVLASIGDQQTVEEDLSSFSSHMKTLNTMVECGASRVHACMQMYIMHACMHA
jgi:DNA mismatch repair protein MutS2